MITIALLKGGVGRGTLVMYDISIMVEVNCGMEVNGRVWGIVGDSRSFPGRGI